MIKSLTSLRGIFILFIFLHHCSLYSGGGSMAVAFFFVLGGFCMTLGYREKIQVSDFSYKRFILKRAIKFYPLHWMCLIATLPTLLIHPLAWGKAIGLFGINAALLQSWIPVESVYFSYNAVSWYLCDTMFFTIMFPALCRIITSTSKKGKAAIATAIAGLYAVVVALIPTKMYHPILYICPLIRLTDFVLGIYLALAFMALKEKSKPVRISSFALQVISILLIVFLVIESCYLSDNARLIAPLYWPLVGALILSVSLSDAYGGGRGWLENKWLFRLGKLSFVIYMVHQVIMRYLTNVFRLLHYENDIVYFLLAILLTGIVSVVVDRYILRPLSQWLIKRISA